MRAWLRPRILLTTFLFSPLALSDCPELLTNGDFESGSPSPWGLIGGDTFLGDDVIPDPYTPDNLFYEIRYRDYETVRTVWDGGLQQAVTLTEGASYVLTFWARGDDAVDPDTFDDTSPGWVSVEEEGGYLDLDEPLEWIWDWEGTIEGKGDSYTFEFTAYESGPANLTLYFGEEDIDLRIDSIALQEVSSPECDASGGAGGTGGGGSGGASTGGASSGGASSG